MIYELNQSPFRIIDTENQRISEENEPTRIAVITVEPGVQRFSRESEAFGSSFLRQCLCIKYSNVLAICRSFDSFYQL